MALTCQEIPLFRNYMVLVPMTNDDDVDFLLTILNFNGVWAMVKL